MQITAELLARAATWPDRKLLRLFDKWRREYGIDPALFGIDAKDAQSIRHALVQADRATVDRLNAMLEKRK